MTQNAKRTDRLPPMRDSDYSDAQKRAVEDFMAVRKTSLSGPWHAFVRSPELLIHAQRMGDHLRFRSRFAGRLADLATLLVAREWTQDFEFAVHSLLGAKAGLTEATIEAIRDGRRPEGLDAEEQLVVDVVNELMRRRSLADATWDRAKQRFGEQGLVDLCGLVGYYMLLATVMNAARTPVPAGASDLPRFPN